MTLKPHRPSDAPGWVTRVQLPEPSLQDNTADADRLGEALKRRFDLDTMDVDLSLSRRLPVLLRENRYKLRCLLCRDRRRGVLIHGTRDR